MVCLVESERVFQELFYLIRCDEGFETLGVMNEFLDTAQVRRLGCSRGCIMTYNGCNCGPVDAPENGKQRGNAGRNRKASKDVHVHRAAFSMQAGS